MMTTKTTCAAVIGCTMEEELLEQLSLNKVETYHWKKIVPPYNAADASNADATEMANSINSIAEDNDITLVFISPKYLSEASKLIQAGKHVRVV